MSGFGTGSVDPFPVPEKNGLLVFGEQDEVLLADYTRHHSKPLDNGSRIFVLFCVIAKMPILQAFWAISHFVLVS